MRVGNVSGANFPPPPQNQPPLGAAASYHCLSSIGSIADMITSSGTHAVSATAAVQSSETDQMLNSDLQSYADLAEIDLYLQTYMGPKGPLVFNDPFLAGIINNLKAQSGNCDANTQALITKALGTFSISGNTVTFNSLTSYSSFWNTGGGLANVMSYLNSTIYGSSLQPSVPDKTISPPPPDTPGVFVNLAIIMADAMLYPAQAPNSIDTNFWGYAAGGTTIGQTFPYALVTYAYQMEFNEGGTGMWGSVDSDVQNLFNILKTPYQQVGSTTAPNFCAMYNQMIANPSQFTQIGSFNAWQNEPFYFFFSDPKNLSAYYGMVLDPLYNGVTNPDTTPKT